MVRIIANILIIGVLVGIASIFYVRMLNEAKGLKNNESLNTKTYLFC